MKLPFDFGIKLIFRLVFPGVVFAAVMFPAIEAVLHAFGISVKFEYLFPIAAIAFGWALVVSDMHIYMLFEGRRYWPYRLRRLLIWLQKRRLKRLSDIVDKPDVDRRRFLEASVEYALYPIDEGGDAYVAHPTRLGNIIEAFETYPKIKYGLDAIFYWNRLWVVLDKDLRDEIDSAQAVVDSSIYITFVFLLSGLMMLVYAGIGIAEHINLHWFSNIHLPYLPEPAILIGLGVVCFAVGFLIYRSSLYAHVQFGEMFKAVFDQFQSRLVFDHVLAEIGLITGDPHVLAKSSREKNQIVWRYLRWHLIRDESTGKNLRVKQWLNRQRAPSPDTTAGEPH